MTRRTRRLDVLPDYMTGPLLRLAGECRQAVIRDALARVKPFGPVYRAGEAVLDAIDRLAEAITGEKDHFSLRGSRPDDPSRRPDAP